MAYNILTPEEIRDRIFVEAKELFLEKGIKGTEMKDIATKSGIGRSTLYRYFPQKEQLAFLVTIDICNRLMVDILPAYENKKLSGFQKVEIFCYHNIHILFQSAPYLTYLGEFDRMFERDYPEIPEAQDFMAGIQIGIKKLADYISSGQVDGSIVAYENPNIISAVLVNTMLGLSQRMISRSDHYQMEHGYSSIQVISKTIELLLRAIKV